MNKISGKITHKETGIGIPDLLAVIYDVDPNTRPEEILADAPAMTTNDSSTAVQPSPFNLGDRIGSVLTDRDGKFSLEYENTEFQIRNAEEKRPDILLLVTLPEEIGQNSRSQILFVSPTIRQNAGRTESYLIRLTTEQLTKAGIQLPTLAAANAEQPESVVARFNEAAERGIKIDDGLRTIAQKQVKNVRDRLNAFHDDFKPALIKSLSRLPDLSADTPENIIERERIVAPGDSVSGKSNATIMRGIDDVINSNEVKKRAVRRSYLSLTDEQKIALQNIADDAEDEAVSGEDVERILSNNLIKPRPRSVLTRVNPILQICREVSNNEDDCAEILLGDASGGDVPVIPDDSENDEPPPSDTGHVPGANVEAITKENINFYLARLMETMTSPEEPSEDSSGNLPADKSVFGLTRRADKDEIYRQIKDFSLKTSPADVPAFHDFHSLQIAFEHVWQEAIDEGIINLAQNAYDLIVENGGDPRVMRESESPLKTLFAEGRLVQTAFNQNALTDSRNTFARRKIEDDTATVDNDDDGVTTSNNSHPTTGGSDTNNHSTDNSSNHGSGQTNAPRERIPALLAALSQRLNEAYNFTIYAANEKERSVNFGIIVTYRQEWTPQAYQAGELVKTLTLAPKQTQKITVTKKSHKKRFRKEVENNLRSRRDESNQTTRAEQEIVRRAATKTNFSMTAQETISASIPEVGEASASATQSWSREASQNSDDVKKAFHEAVFKSAQEYKNETTTEVTSEETEDYETTETTEISNPNDEIAVTFLFYELQRRYRVTEAIHQLRPVVFVAQEMPAPHEIDEDWILTHDWILRRVILDDSFIPALDYLAENIVGDEAALAEIRQNIKAQRQIVSELKDEIKIARQRATNQQALFENAVFRKALTPKEEEDDGGFLSDVFDVVTAPVRIPTQLAVKAADALGDFAFGSDAAAPTGQNPLDALKESAQRAADQARDVMFRLEREVTALNALTETYAKAYSAHLNRQMQIKRAQVHFKENILYYMKAVWTHEPPDQRFFRLHNVKVPMIEARSRRFKIDFSDAVTDSMTGAAHHSLARFNPEPVKTYGFEDQTKIRSDFKFAPLSKVADLDNLLGFKGNYMIFPLVESNALTDFMMEPYVDRAFGNLIDPDEFGNWSLEDFSKYVCCLKEKLTAAEFESIKQQLTKQYKRLLSAPRRADDILTIPSGSLFIEALPAAHSLIEEFKARHRAIDVKKAQAEVRKMELENIRYAARVLDEKLEDPEIEKKIVIEGDASQLVITPEDI